MQAEFPDIADQLIAAGRKLHSLDMVPATSGNFSARLSEKEIAITVSGVHKGDMTRNDFMILDIDGNAYSDQKPSAESGLHLQLYRTKPQIQCVLHTHSRCSTMTRNYPSDRFILENYELLKAFEGIDTHEFRVTIPVFENDQDIARLAGKTGNYLQSNPETPAYIIRGHGFYTWAGSINSTVHQCEALEFLLKCELDSTGKN